ncbi:MAG: NAD-dependent epimerase/dehydratase family protein [Bacteroidota bacterium]
MKKIFISGATGFIGSKLAMRLAEEGNTVHALYRSEWKKKYIEHENIRLFKGDITNTESLRNAMNGCEEVYHVAAFAKVWTPDPSDIYHLNIEGAMNVIKEAQSGGVKKIVVTSTAAVFGPSGRGYVDENSRPEDYFIHYEHSKAILESVIQTIAKCGIHIVTVNPSRVYGPGILSESNGVTRIIERFIRGKWRMIPGNGKSEGNYVFIDDVVEGHILAMAKGRSGESYILGGENADFNTFFRKLSRVSKKEYSLFNVPLFLMLAASHLMLLQAKNTGWSPIIIPGLVKKYNENFRLRTEKAEKKLGYSPIDLEEGMKKTIEWLKKQKK